MGQIGHFEPKNTKIQKFLKVFFFMFPGQL